MTNMNMRERLANNRVIRQSDQERDPIRYPERFTPMGDIRPCSALYGPDFKTIADEMGKDEQSLLVYLECRYVDNGGKIDPRQINEADRRIMASWNECRFIATSGYHIVEFSYEVWAVAHTIRIARALAGSVYDARG